MKVFRIEHLELGVGPMCGEVLSIGGWYENFSDHPIPADYENFLAFADDRVMSKDHVFGMTSKKTLFGLILENAVLNRLVKCGFALYIYEVEQDFVVFSEIEQVCFDRSMAKLIDIVD